MMTSANCGRGSDEPRQTEHARARTRRRTCTDDHGDAVDEHEAVEADAGREPELAALHREVVAQRAHLGHRVADGRGRRIERPDEGEVAETRRGPSGRSGARLMPKPPAIPVTKNAGGPPIGPLTAPNAKNDEYCSPSGAALCRSRRRPRARRRRSARAACRRTRRCALGELAQPPCRLMPADARRRSRSPPRRRPSAGFDAATRRRPSRTAADRRPRRSGRTETRDRLRTGK